MPTVLPWTGRLTTLGYKVPPATVYTLLGTLISVGESSSVGSVDVPYLASLAKQKLPTLLDPGELTFTISFDTADPGIVELRSLMNTPAMISWEITYPDTGTTVCTGFISGFEVSGVEQESLVQADLTITLSGVPVYTAHV